MAERATYRDLARRQGQGWDVEVPEVPDLKVHVERLDQAAAAAVDAIATATDVDASDVEVEVTSTTNDDEVDAQVVDVVAAERHPDTASQTVVTAQQRLAHRLVGMGLSHHDSAYLMNMSHHRVRHLVQPREPVPGGAGATARADDDTDTTTASDAEASDTTAAARPVGSDDSESPGVTP